MDSELTTTPLCGLFVDKAKIITLDGEKLSLRHCGRYQSDLILVFDPERHDDGIISQRGEADTELNVECGNRIWPLLRGEFHTSQDGDPTLEVGDDGPHTLFRVNWGGPYGASRDRPSRETLGADCVYYRDAASNSGGQGHTWFVLPNGWRRACSAEES